MVRRLVVPVIASAAAVVLACAPGLMAAAQGATTPGWSIAELYGPQAGYPHLQAVSASGSSDAWVSGQSFALDLVIYEWNGTTWTQLTVPAGFTCDTCSINDSVIGAASASDMWTFPIVSTSSATKYYALQWNGSAWKTDTLKGTDGIFGTAVFSPTNAWAFGQAPTTQQGLGYGAPYAARYNGTAWRRVSMPGAEALGLSPLSASDIWAFGPTAATAGLTNQDMVAMHWNGKSWSTLQIPIYQISGDRAVVQGGVALARDNVWVAEGLPANPGTGQIEGPGIVLAHWNGSAWTKVVENASYSWQGALTSDGHGGLWLQGVSAATSADAFLHLHNGTLSAVAEPTTLGLIPSVPAMALIPGTESLWATESLSPGATGFPDGAILSYTP